jgi:hypothetical protein
MTFDEVTKKAAREAEKAVTITNRSIKNRRIYDEDDITGFFIGSLQTTLDGAAIDGVTLSATILRHRRGIAAEESRIGADMLIHINMDTTTQAFSKGVLIQAKKSDPTDYWSPTARGELVSQCTRMLAITPSAFVFNYSERGIRCGAATRIVGARGPQSVNYLCGWTSYRFFLELFRCPIGDPRITSAQVEDLPVPYVLRIGIGGEIALDEGSSTY